MMATQEVEQAIASTTKDDRKKRPSPNNPEEASKFVEAVGQAVTSFTEVIEKNDPDAVENAYADFVGKYYELLSNVEDYYIDASTEGALNIIEDKQCKILLQPSICEAEEQKLCPDPIVSTDNILTGHQMLNRLEKLPGFKTYEDGEEMAIVQLFYALQWAHNTATEVMGHLAFLGRTLSPSQFSFILKHLVRPLIQFNIPPPYLCHPGELTFVKADLTPDETFEQRAVNRMLPKPYHSKLQKSGKQARHPLPCSCCTLPAPPEVLHRVP